MRIHKRRYLNALKKAAKINHYLKKGYHVFYLGERIEQGFTLEDNEIVLKLRIIFLLGSMKTVPIGIMGTGQVSRNTIKHFQKIFKYISHQQGLSYEAAGLNHRST